MDSMPIAIKSVSVPILTGNQLMGLVQQVAGNDCIRLERFYDGPIFEIGKTSDFHAYTHIRVVPSLDCFWIEPTRTYLEVLVTSHPWDGSKPQVGRTNTPVTNSVVTFADLLQAAFEIAVETRTYPEYIAPKP